MLVKVCKTDKDLDNPIVAVRMSGGRCEDGKVFINGVAYQFDHYFWVNDGEEIDFIQEK